MTGPCNGQFSKNSNSLGSQKELTNEKFLGKPEKSSSQPSLKSPEIRKTELSPPKIPPFQQRALVVVDNSVTFRFFEKLLKVLTFYKFLI